jgi:macrolide-specific efflux system membrane fusion protein
MKIIKKIIITVLVLAIAAVGWYLVNKNRLKNSQEQFQEVSPFIGDIKTTISTTGSVLPRNRLEIRPPVNGRLDSILVVEGGQVKTGDIMAWMSSTERAALLDSARGQGAEELKKWQDTYKAIPLIAPIDGSVIVSLMEPGQTVTTTEAVLVLSDTLIVRAQVDETDIGKIKIDMPAVVSLDAYSGNKIQSHVQHIYYESTTVNNVTVYNVDLILDNVPDFFRSGMNASIDFVVENKESVVLLPQELITKAGKRTFVMVKQNGGQPVQREVVTGISDDKNIEIVSGLSTEDVVVTKSKKYKLPSSNMGKNPFMPSRPGGSGGGRPSGGGRGPM